LVNNQGSDNPAAPAFALGLESWGGTVAYWRISVRYRNTTIREAELDADGIPRTSALNTIAFEADFPVIVFLDGYPVLSVGPFGSFETGSFHRDGVIRMGIGGSLTLHTGSALDLIARVLYAPVVSETLDDALGGNRVRWEYGVVVNKISDQP
jgi:hypothetical protein